MALLERVTTLIRANINDLVDKAEEPEKMIKQVILDMQNQLLQVKTQVAISLADQHLLEKKAAENGDKSADWVRRAELAVDKHQDDLARAALDRSMTYHQLAESFTAQVLDQKTQVENLKSALRKLDQKLTEAEAKSDLLIAQQRRSRALANATDAEMAMVSEAEGATFDRMRNKVARTVAVGQAKSEMSGENLEARLVALEKEDKIDHLLAALKAKRGVQADSSYKSAT